MSPSSLARRHARRLSPSSLARRHARRLVPTETAPARANRTALRTRARRLLGDDAGMSTVEYAIGCIAAAAFAAVLYAVVSGDSVVTALTQLVQRALTAGF